MLIIENGGVHYKLFCLPMPGKITAYKKIAKGVIDKCRTSNTDVVKCIIALCKDSFVSSQMRGTYVVKYICFAP